ncbi:MAG: DMT family transporter [Candidatus Aminicenantes bacterium]|nr:MAG: DMT family transporter [Candidatus Aminicenantes bacterium]
MKTRSVIYLGIFAVMLAMGHILQKMVLNQGVDRFVFAFLRISMGFVLISMLLLAKKHHPVTLVKKNIRHFLVLGVCFSGCGILLKLWGLSYTTATNAAFIMSLSSVAVVIFAYFLLKEKAPKRFYAVALMMIIGVYLVTTGGKQLMPQFGDIIIFGLAFLIGSMQVYGKKVLESLTVIQTAFGRSFVGMIFLGLLIPVFAPHGFSTIPNFPVLLLVLANGITFSSSIILFYKALQIEQASNTGMFALLVPVLTAVLGYFLLAEMLNVYQIIGGVIILTGSYFISRLKIKPANF